MVKLAASLHCNLGVAVVDGMGPDDWFEPATEDPTATFNCVAHRAQLAVTDVFDDDASIKPLIGRVRAIVTQFNRFVHNVVCIVAGLEQRSL